MNIKVLVTIVSLGLVATASAMAIKRAKDKNGETSPEDGGTTKDEPTGRGTDEVKPSPIAKQTFEDKVKVLQSMLYAGAETCDVDGAVGKQTNGMLDYWFCDYLCEYDKDKAFASGYPNLKKKGKGAINSSNVDYYIGVMKMKASPRQKLLAYLDKQQKAKEITRTMSGFKI